MILQTAKLGVLGMHCSSCSTAVEGALMRLPGVASAVVSLTMEQAEIEYDAALISIVKTLLPPSLSSAIPLNATLVCHMSWPCRSSDHKAKIVASPQLVDLFLLWIASISYYLGMANLYLLP